MVKLIKNMSVVGMIRRLRNPRQVNYDIASGHPPRKCPVVENIPANDLDASRTPNVTIDEKAQVLAREVIEDHERINE